MTDFSTTWDDPDLDAKAREFFLDNFNDLRHTLLRAKREEQETAKLPTKAEAKDGCVFQLGLDNLPRKVLPEHSFLHMMKLHNDITRLTSSVPYPTEDAAEAGLFLVRRTILCLANRFAEQTIFLAMFDDRYRTSQPNLKIDTTGLFAVNGWSEEDLSCYACLPNYIALVLRLTPGLNVSGGFSDVIGVLQMLSRIYFNTVQAAYGLPEVNACSMAFDGVLASLTNGITISSRVNAYRDSCREMHAAIVTFVKNGYQTDFQKMYAEIAKALTPLQGKMDLLLAREKATNSGGKEKKRMRRLCPEEAAARYFGVDPSTIWRWHCYQRDPNDPNASRPPVEFPNGDVSRKEMKRAGEKYRGLTAT